MCTLHPVSELFKHLGAYLKMCFFKREFYSFKSCSSGRSLGHQALLQSDYDGTSPAGRSTFRITKHRQCLPASVPHKLGQGLKNIDRAFPGVLPVR